MTAGLGHGLVMGESVASSPARNCVYPILLTLAEQARDFVIWRKLQRTFSSWSKPPDGQDSKLSGYSRRSAGVARFLEQQVDLLGDHLGVVLRGEVPGAFDPAKRRVEVARETLAHLDRLKAVGRAPDHARRKVEIGTPVGDRERVPHIERLDLPRERGAAVAGVVRPVGLKRGLCLLAAIVAMAEPRAEKICLNSGSGRCCTTPSSA
jgi:hypothetical protein